MEIFFHVKAGRQRGFKPSDAFCLASLVLRIVKMMQNVLKTGSVSCSCWGWQNAEVGNLTVLIKVSGEQGTEIFGAFL